MTDPDREYVAIVAELERAGLIEQTTDEGKPALRLAPEGKGVAEQMALSSEDDAQAMLDARLDGRGGSAG